MNFSSKYNKIIILLSLFYLLFILSINAQSTIQSTGFPTEQNSRSDAQVNFPDGQTFVATSTGTITAITIKMNAGNSYTGGMTLWLGVEPGDGNKIGGTPYQTFTIDVAKVTGITTINLATPFSVIQGNTYRMEFAPVGATNAAFDANDITLSPMLEAYSDGVRTDNGNYTTNRDFNFSITIEHVQDIPTFSQWSLLVFSLLILNLGLSLIYHFKVSHL